MAENGVTAATNIKSSLTKDGTGKRKANEDEDSDEDMDLLDVEFEWFDPQEIDFHGLKTLMRQLFDVDNELLDLSGLANLILSQPLLGSTVKVSDGENPTNMTDPYAFLTVLNLHEHTHDSAILSLKQYLINKTAKHTNEPSLPYLLADTKSPQVGLILTERFINMPSEIVPPMYNMLLEEIDWAVQEKEPYTFTHYLIFSKTYTEIESKLSHNGDSMEVETENVDHAQGPPSKKSKKRSGTKNSAAVGTPNETFYFHPEDEILHQHALWHCDFEYTRQGGDGAADSKRTFQEMGIRPRGHLILIEASRFKEAVEGVRIALGGGAA